jgi:hypothetical protein
MTSQGPSFPRALIVALLACGCVRFGAGRMQHTTNRLQAGVHLTGFGLYANGEVAEGAGEREKEVVSLNFDLGPEDDVGLKVLAACELKGLSEDGCEAVMQQVGNRFSGKHKHKSANTQSAPFSEFVVLLL